MTFLDYVFANLLFGVCLNSGDLLSLQKSMSFYGKEENSHIEGVRQRGADRRIAPKSPHDAEGEVRQVDEIHTGLAGNDRGA